ncbi:MAG: hypothetical protein II535_04715 [Bacteroidales bacterium]|nr:hypothetical protein [Bacteroidales bacterium]
MEKQDYVKSLMEYPCVQDMMECERAEAKEEGIQIGIEQGREEGREEGRKEGRKAEKRLLVRNMLAEGLDPAVVAKVAGLTEEEIQAMSAEA